MVVTDVGLLRLSLWVLGGGLSIVENKTMFEQNHFFSFLFYGHHVGVLTVICTASSPSPASLASMVNSTGREAGTPVVLRPGPLARTLLASWVGSTFTLYGLTQGGEERHA